MPAKDEGPIKISVVCHDTQDLIRQQPIESNIRFPCQICKKNSVSIRIDLMAYDIVPLHSCTSPSCIRRSKALLLTRMMSDAVLTKYGVKTTITVEAG